LLSSAEKLTKDHCWRK